VSFSICFWNAYLPVFWLFFSCSYSSAPYKGYTPHYRVWLGPRDVQLSLPKSISNITRKLQHDRRNRSSGKASERTVNQSGEISMRPFTRTDFLNGQQLMKLLALLATCRGVRSGAHRGAVIPSIYSCSSRFQFVVVSFCCSSAVLRLVYPRRDGSGHGLGASSCEVRRCFFASPPNLCQMIQLFDKFLVDYVCPIIFNK
jgi:hypothetical protein